MKKLNAGEYSEVPTELQRWVHGAKGEVLGGLVKRLAWEAELFAKGSLQPKVTCKP